MADKASFIQERLEAAEKKAEDLQQENARMVKELAEANKKIANYFIAEDAIEVCGVVFKKIPGNGYCEMPYCIRCKRPMTMPGGLVGCNVCGYFTRLTQVKINEIVRHLNSSEGFQ